MSKRTGPPLPRNARTVTLLGMGILLLSATVAVSFPGPGPAGAGKKPAVAPVAEEAKEADPTDPEEAGKAMDKEDAAKEEKKEDAEEKDEKEKKTSKKKGPKAKVGVAPTKGVTAGGGAIKKSGAKGFGGNSTGRISGRPGGGSLSPAALGQAGLAIDIALGQLNPNHGAAPPDTLPILADIIRLVNEERGKRNLPLFTVQQNLMDMAQKQAGRMSEVERKEGDPLPDISEYHFLEDLSFEQRLKESGYHAAIAGEILVQSVTTAEGVLQQLLNTSGGDLASGIFWSETEGLAVDDMGKPVDLRGENTLRPDFSEIGVGYAASEETLPYFAVVYGRPRPVPKVLIPSNNAYCMRCH